MNAGEKQPALDAAIVHLVTALRILDDHRAGEIAAAHITHAIDLLRGNSATRDIDIRQQPHDAARLGDRSN